MKKLFVIGLAVILTACNTASPEITEDSSSLDKPENVETEIAALFCGDIFSNKEREEEISPDGRIPEEISPENLLKQASDLPEESEELVKMAFENSEFQDVAEKSDIMNFCFYPNHFVFSSYDMQNFAENIGENTVGVYSGGNLTLSVVEEFQPGHEFDACDIRELTEETLNYECREMTFINGGITTYSLDLSSGASTMTGKIDFEEPEFSDQ